MASTGELPEAMEAPTSLFGRYSIFFAAAPMSREGSFFGSGRDDAEFGGNQAQAGFGDHQGNARDTRIGFKQAQNCLRVERAARTRDADRDDFVLCFWHGMCMEWPV